jgi:hypothetical protein
MARERERGEQAGRRVRGEGGKLGADSVIFGHLAAHVSSGKVAQR